MSRKFVQVVAQAQCHGPHEACWALGETFDDSPFEPFSGIRANRRGRHLEHQELGPDPPVPQVNPVVEAAGGSQPRRRQQLTPNRNPAARHGSPRGKSQSCPSWLVENQHPPVAAARHGQGLIVAAGPGVGLTLPYQVAAEPERHEGPHQQQPAPTAPEPGQRGRGEQEPPGEPQVRQRGLAGEAGGGRRRPGNEPSTPDPHSVTSGRSRSRVRSPMPDTLRRSSSLA